MEFDYKINEMREFLIITLKGKVSRDCKEQWQACFKESTGYNSKTVVIVLKDVVGIDHSMSRDFAIFQQDLRKANKIFLIGLKLALKADLDGRGLIRIHEIKNNMEEIIAKAA